MSRERSSCASTRWSAAHKRWGGERGGRPWLCTGCRPLFPLGGGETYPRGVKPCGGNDKGHMPTLATSVREAAARLEAVIRRVCGACGNACCHQGTMMGRADAQRLYKGLLLEPGLAARVEEGLAGRAGELRAELAAVAQVAEILRRSSGPERRPPLEALDEALQEWQDFCDLLERPGPLTQERLHEVLRFPAIRANALRALREFPGAVEALAAQDPRAWPASGAGPRAPQPFFRENGRRMSAPRCLFHAPAGCLAEAWKPAKCANFFCAGDPNVLEAVAQEMGFEDFVRANFAVLSPDQVLRYVETELRLGRQYVEPKIILEPNTALREALPTLLRGGFAAVETRVEESNFMWSTEEAHTRLGALPPNVAYLVETDQIDGGALYELAVALDRLRIEGTPPAFYLIARRLADRSFLPHPMWADRMMSQPLGFLDLIAVEV